MLRLLLETKGFEVSEAADGPQALAAIQQSWPDLALVDIGLPQMNGYEVARRIRAMTQRDGHPAITLVALTGYGQQGDVEAALEVGFDRHLTKPPEPGALDEVLSMVPAGKHSS
jgi:CheY-like chemotaxis protein